MLGRILQVITFLLLLAFLVCDIVFLILNKNDMRYQNGFGISGFLFFPFVIIHGVITIIGWPFPGGYSFETYYMKDIPFGILLTIYGIIGVLSQLIIGLVLNFPNEYFLGLIILCSISLISTLVGSCIFYCIR